MRETYIIGSLIVAGALAAGCGGVTQATASLAIKSPVNNTPVTVGADKKIPVTFDTNFTLRALNQCAGIQNCGHVWILVDSNTCDQAGKGYNTLAISTPTEADLSLCPQVAGQHTITAVLHDDLEAPVKDAFGNAATSMVTVTVSQ